MNRQLRINARDYLLLREMRGYQPGDIVWLLRDYLDFLTQEGFSRVTITNALAWACLPANISPRWRNQRLAVVRAFAAHLHAGDPGLAELIPAGLLPARAVRPAPYLYSPEQVATLIDRAQSLSPVLRGRTLGAIIGLMAATGIRTVEALALNTEHVDAGQATILVRGKGGKQRLLPVHPSTITALGQYRTAAARAMMKHLASDGALFINQAGTRTVANTVQQTFREVVTACGIRSGPGSRNPRLYDLRHTFAVNTLIDAHRDGEGVDARIAALATYLGHGSPIHTYWYLTASPQLLHLVNDRIQQHTPKGQP